MVEEVYTQFAGQTHINGARKDRFGNPEGSNYDLAKNEAFKGRTIAVLHLYNSEIFDFKLPSNALREKGFDIYRWTSVPNIKDFKSILTTACQFWLISSNNLQLSKEHLDVIKVFFNSGRGIYIWGDNEPFYADANNVMMELFGTTMKGNIPGEKIVNPQSRRGGPGYIEHLITTGIEYLYEGHTIATIQESYSLEPLMYGSAGNLLIAIYDKEGKRAIIDGGFTRLYIKWDSAGTGRYVKNAASWLVNFERWNYLHPSELKKLHIYIELISPFCKSCGSFSLQDKETIIFGRDNIPANISRLEEVSRKHFSLALSNDGTHVVVINTSTNGLLVNDIKLEKESSVVLMFPVILNLAGVIKLQIKEK